MTPRVPETDSRNRAYNKEKFSWYNLTDGKPVQYETGIEKIIKDALSLAGNAIKVVVKDETPKYKLWAISFENKFLNEHIGGNVAYKCKACDKIYVSPPIIVVEDIDGKGNAKCHTECANCKAVLYSRIVKI